MDEIKAGDLVWWHRPTQFGTQRVPCEIAYLTAKGFAVSVHVMGSKFVRIVSKEKITKRYEKLDEAIAAKYGIPTESRRGRYHEKVS